uniref:SHSP domain-containing protein n=1 Tax=Steinernema glaseri TaxID=37863 RepID=A0A1I7YAF2_9BILA
MHQVVESTMDAMIDKFVPVDGGSFRLKQALNREQLERLVLKCEMSEKKVTIEMPPETYTPSSKVTDFFDFDKYYSKKEYNRGNLTAVRDGANLQLCVESVGLGSFRWQWTEMDGSE